MPHMIAKKIPGLPEFSGHKKVDTDDPTILIKMDQLKEILEKVLNIEVG